MTDDKRPQDPQEDEAAAPIGEASEGGAATGDKTTEALERHYRPPEEGEEIFSGLRRYVVGKPINAGVFGTTFDCVDEWDNDLAMKVLLPRGTYDDVKERFDNEFQRLAHLRHPNVTYIYDAFEYRDTFYIVMERCSGNLDDLFRIPQYMGVLWFMPIARCLLQAIDFMHVVSVVHRDIHPRNVLYSFVRNELIPTQSNSLTFKVADMGVSRLENDQDFFGATMANWMVPPEVLDPASFGLLGRKIDIYHAALVLLAVLKGSEQRFSKEEILDGAPRRAAEALDSPCGAPLARALRRHVSSRTATAKDVWRELKEAGCLSMHLASTPNPQVPSAPPEIQPSTTPLEAAAEPGDLGRLREGNQDEEHKS